MRVLTAEDLDACLTFPALIEALREGFRQEITVPLRHHHSLGEAGGPMHLLMPAWSVDAPVPGTYLGTKIVNVFPANGAKGLPAVMGTYLLMSGETGEPLLVLDGTRLTHWRTAAASALAASYLARGDASRLTLIGAGALAPFLVRAHLGVRPIRQVRVWNHRAERAEFLAQTLAASLAEAFGDAAPSIEVTAGLEEAVRWGDIVSTATLSSLPLVQGAWLQPGTHLDLVGAFSMTMREADDAALQRSSLFVDTEAALVEGGDVAIALAAGTLDREAVKATLIDLCRGRHAGRADAEEITAFKSVGSAAEDLAAAMLVRQSLV